jgi:hypothetical protein
MEGQNNYEDTWKMIQMANMERLEEANRIHLAKLAQQTRPRNPAALSPSPSPFSRFLYQRACTISALLWNIL